MVTKKASLWQSLDIMGSKIRYKYNKNYKYKTSCGGILSILVILSLLMVFLSLLVDWNDTSSPSDISSSFNMLPTVSDVMLSDTSRPIFFFYVEHLVKPQDTQSNGIYANLDEFTIAQYIKYEITYIRSLQAEKDQGQQNALKISYSLQECLNLATNDPYYQAWTFSTTWTGRKDETKNHKLCMVEQKREPIPFLEKDLNQILVKFRYCKAGENGGLCASQIVPYKRVWIGYHNPSAKMSISNFLDPIRASYDDYTLYEMKKSYNFTKLTYQSMIKVNIKNKRGLSYLDTFRDSWVMPFRSGFLEKPFNNSQNETWLVKLFLEAVDQDKNYVRTYQTLVDIMSLMSGMQKIIVIILGFAYFYYNRSNLRLKIIESFINIRDKSLPSHYTKRFKYFWICPTKKRILTKGTRSQRLNLFVQEEATKIVLNQMDYVNNIKDGILHDAFFDAVYPKFIKTLIPLAFLNKTFQERYHEIENVCDSNGVCIRKKQKKREQRIEDMNYLEALEMLIDEDVPSDPRLFKIKNFILGNIPEELIVNLNERNSADGANEAENGEEVIEEDDDSEGEIERKEEVEEGEEKEVNGHKDLKPMGRGSKLLYNFEENAIVEDSEEDEEAKDGDIENGDGSSNSEGGDEDQESSNDSDAEENKEDDKDKVEDQKEKIEEGLEEDGGKE